jgi:hypothetical protein
MKGILTIVNVTKAFSGGTNGRLGVGGKVP